MKVDQGFDKGAWVWRETLGMRTKVDGQTYGTPTTVGIRKRRGNGFFRMKLNGPPDRSAMIRERPMCGTISCNVQGTVT